MQGPYWSNVQQLTETSDADRSRMRDIHDMSSPFVKSIHFEDDRNVNSLDKFERWLLQGMPDVTWDPRGGQNMPPTWNRVKDDAHDGRFRDQYQTYKRGYQGDLTFYVALDSANKVYVLLRVGGRTRSARGPVPASLLYTYN